MEVAREVMAEEEHKDTIKAFKHFSSPHSSLFSKTIFGNVMYVLYLYLYSNPYSDVELLLHQPKSATLHTFSLKKVFHQSVSKDIPTTNIIWRQVILYQTIQPEKMLSSVQKEKVWNSINTELFILKNIILWIRNKIKQHILHPFFLITDIVVLPYR